MSGDQYAARLADYVDVAERITEFYQRFPDGRIQTEVTELTEKRVTVKALVYRKADDPLPATGHSWLGIPGTTPYTHGSEIENAETSAVGRAIVMAGIASKKVASADEVKAKAQRPTPPVAAPPPPAKPPPAPATHPGVPAAVAVHREPPPEPQEFDFRTKQQLSPTLPPEEPPPPQFQFSQPPDAHVPGRQPHGGFVEGGVHETGHRPLKARQNGSLYCPTHLPDGGWCPWKSS